MDLRLLLWTWVEKELANEILSFRDFNNINDAHPVELQKLYENLILSIQSELKTDKLVVIPHDILHYLPFAALSDGENYLIDSAHSFYPS